MSRRPVAMGDTLFTGRRILWKMDETVSQSQSNESVNKFQI